MPFFKIMFLCAYTLHPFVQLYSVYVGIIHSVCVCVCIYLYNIFLCLCVQSLATIAFGPLCKQHTHANLSRYSLYQGCQIYFYTRGDKYVSSMYNFYYSHIINSFIPVFFASDLRLAWPSNLSQRSAPDSHCK